jgi:hypothetical protein
MNKAMASDYFLESHSGGIRMMRSPVARFESDIPAEAVERLGPLIDDKVRQEIEALSSRYRELSGRPVMHEGAHDMHARHLQAVVGSGGTIAPRTLASFQEQVAAEREAIEAQQRAIHLDTLKLLEPPSREVIRELNAWMEELAAARSTLVAQQRLTFPRPLPDPFTDAVAELAQRLQATLERCLELSHHAGTNDPGYMLKVLCALTLDQLRAAPRPATLFEKLAAMF